MGALAIPQRMKSTPATRFLCAKIGVRINGRDMQDRVHEYDVADGTALVDGPNGFQVVKGQIEPYWRPK
jgi:hypothetical protein